MAQALGCATLPWATPGNRGLSADEHMNQPLWMGNMLEGENGPKASPGKIEFTHPDFALMCACTHLRAGARSWFYISYDRCRSWLGPYWLPMFDQTGIAAVRIIWSMDRIATRYCSPRPSPTARRGASSARDHGRRQDIRVCLLGHTGAGGLFDHAGERATLATGNPDQRTLQRGTAGVRSAALLDRPLPQRGQRRKLAVAQPAGAGYRARRQSAYVDQTARWAALPDLWLPRCALCHVRHVERRRWRDLERAATLRSGAGNHDIGYPRTAQLAGGHMVTVYYFNDDAEGDRYIAATLWEPPQRAGA